MKFYVRATTVFVLGVVLSSCGATYAPSPGMISEAKGTPTAARPSRLLASRSVLCRDDAVPRGHGAYSDLVIPTRPTSQTRARYVALCEEFLARYSDDEGLAADGVLINERVLTIWWTRRRLPEADRTKCDQLIQEYDYERAARIARELELSGRPGPILVAARDPFKSNAGQEYLLLDLSDRGPDDIRQGMKAWSQRLRMGPDCWDNGWLLERIRLRLRATLGWLDESMVVTKQQQEDSG